MLLNCHQVMAQFNTVGRNYQRKEIKNATTAVESDESCDSVMPVDSIKEPLESAPVSDEDVIKQYMSVSYPLKAVRIGSGFGMRKHPIMHKYCMHNGVDLQARYEEVYSMFSGTVIAVSQDKRSGKYVTVKSSNYTISYCHLSAPLVTKGAFVNAGEVIAKSGNTGMSTGPHLHLTTKKDGKAINPTILLDFIRSVKEKCLSLISSY